MGWPRIFWLIGNPSLDILGDMNNPKIFWVLNYIVYFILNYRSYRPPAKITVTTQMAAPQPMVRPDFYGVRKQNQGEISVFLPRASEEYGPISHYYVIVIPNSNSSAVRYPDQYNTEDLVAYSKSKIFF